MKIAKRGLLATTASLALVLAACGGSDEDSSSDTSGSDSSATTAEGSESSDTAAESDDTSAPETSEGGDATATTTADSSGGSESSGEKLSVVNVVNGYLGDSGFFDDAEHGIQLLAEQGNETDTLQADPNNPAQWKANLESVSNGDWDIVVAGTSQMVDILTESAATYSDQNYILYDAVVEAPNVASITYKQNEGSFLAGVLAASATTDPEAFPLANEDKVVALVGGMDIPVINDFVAGFKAGVEAVDPEIEVLVSYVGNFTDSQKGYDQAKAMFDQGADVVFQVAGGAGIGALQAAADANVYGIGVDANQNDLQPGNILASMLKNIATSLDQAVNAAQNGELAYGENTSYGLANDGVGLDFENNSDIVPQEVIDTVNEYKQQVIDGEIVVPTAAG